MAKNTDEPCAMTGALQQDDNYKKFMTNITDGGLRYACAKHRCYPDAERYRHVKVDPADKRDVIVVGAGVCGLATAYELAQIGHNVTILEAQSRVGGRVRTFREGFHEGLHCEAGAMRLPCNHYLTFHYLNTFGIEKRPFQNHNKKGLVKMYDTDAITMEDWENKNGYYTNLWWPGWDELLDEDVKMEYGIQGILDLYEQTVKPVKEELDENSTEQQWQDWVAKWSKLSLEDFLRSKGELLTKTSPFLPWSETAIEAYKVSTYSPLFGNDLVTWLREEMGQWWMDPYLQTPKDGMDMLAKGFVKNNIGWDKDVSLAKNIKYGIRVERVEKTDSLGVNVFGINATTGKEIKFEGNAVFLTVPLPILRQLEVPLTVDRQKALANISYGASTKIMLQCKTRFWQKKVGQGGFSKTNLQIGQLHYPDWKDIEGSDLGESGIPDHERGILLVYTWTDNALTFGAETHERAIASAVNQISTIHPEIIDEFEVGKVQAWYSDPFALGAYASLKPFEYLDSMDKLTCPDDPIYIAGEALSWSNGWIQGALFSGLMQAFAFQNKVEPPVMPASGKGNRLMTMKSGRGKRKNQPAIEEEFHPCKVLLIKKH